MSSYERSQPHDPLAMSLSAADDRVRLNHWLPPRAGVVPRIRIGRHWINLLWALPLIFVLLVIGVAVAQALRELPAVQDFLVRYPGIPPSAGAVTTGFPDWLRLLHFLNLFFRHSLFALVSRFLPTTRGCTGSATARREPNGSASRRRFRAVGYGPPRTIRSPFPRGWASPASVTPSVLPDGGTFRSP